MHLTSDDMQMLNGSLRIMKNMFGALRAMPVKEARMDVQELPDEKKKALYVRKDGKDTMLFDVLAEDAISLGIETPGHTMFGHYSHFQRSYTQSGVVITEERGRVPKERRIEDNTPVIISDPVDGSSHLEALLEKYESEVETVGEALDREREHLGEHVARIKACNSSVTLLKDNTIKYSVILNLLTGEVVVASEPGIFSANIIEVVTIDDVTTPVAFKKIDTLSMLCYTTAKGKYENNRRGTHLRDFNLDKSIHKPCGPNRFGYLLQEPTGINTTKIGVIAHNGEKIQELLPNIAVAFFSQGRLAAYKLFCDRDQLEDRAGKQLTPNLQNSLYDNGRIANHGIKLKFLNNHEYPSEFRDTTVIIPTTNARAMTHMEGMVQNDYAIRIV